MIHAERYTPADQERWNRFNAESRNALFMFDRKYMDYHQDRFRDHSLLFREGEELLALLPMNESGDTLASHGGLTYGGLITGPRLKQKQALECMEEFLRYAREKGFREILWKCIPFLYWSQPAEEDQYALFRCGAELFKVEASTVISLADPLEMATLRKRKIRQADKNGVTVAEVSGREDYEAFIALETRVLEKYHGLRAVHSAAELYLLHSRFPENIRIFAAFLAGAMIAGTVVFEYDRVIHTQYLAADDTARQIGALDLVVSRVIDRYRGQKQWLDFGISTEQGGRVLNEGLIAQKEGFGGRTVVYKTWKINL